MRSLTASEVECALEHGLITPLQADFSLDKIESERCKSDLFYLARNVLGYHDLTESIHHPLCRLVESVNPLIAALASKEFVKTPSGSVDASHARNVAEWNAKYPSLKVVAASATTVASGASATHDTGTDTAGSPAAGSDVGDGGVGGKATDTPTKFYGPPTKFHKNFMSFSLPASTQKLIDQKVIQFNPESRTRLFLLFRGAFKSTIITIAHTIQLMLIWPDIRILIASHKKEGGSQKFLGSIKDHFMRNERFRALFPEFCPKPNQAGQMEWGTSEQVTLPNRSKNANYPESTLEIAGNTTDVTGRHYNYLKIDDIVTRESVTNEAMLERTEEFNALLTFLFDQPEWGVSDYAGTCYHFADLYAKLRQSDQITKFILPVWDEAKVPTIPERFTTEGVEAIRNHPSQTSYQFCTPGETPIWMADGTFKSIKDVQIGDEVIGFTDYSKGKRRKLTKSKVLEKGSLVSSVQNIYMENGDVVRSTPDHQWFTGRQPNKGNWYEKYRREYKPAIKGTRLVKVIHPVFSVKEEQKIADWSWLAGMVDGEGSVKHNSSVVIHQSLEKNPEVCKRLEETLNRLDIKYTKFLKKRVAPENVKPSSVRKYSLCCSYILQSSRQMRVNLVNFGKPAKSLQIMHTMLKNGGDFSNDKIKVVDIKVDTRTIFNETVYWLKTETGNYTAWGYASKNSAQYLLNPVPLEDQVFRPEYFERAGFYYDRLPPGLKVYVLVDPANTQRKASDYTALVTIGIDAQGDLWFIDIIRDKLTLDGRAKLVYDVLKRNGIHVVHYESVGFQSSDAKSIKEMGQRQDWYINVIEVKASKQSKEDRIRGLQYFFEQAKVHWPAKYLYFSKYHQRQLDMVDIFRRELWMFPSCEKDDLADCASFILRTNMTKSAVMKKEEAVPDAFEFWKSVIKDAKVKKSANAINGTNRGSYEVPAIKSWR